MIKKAIVLGALCAILLTGCGQALQESVESDLELAIHLTMGDEGKVDVSAGLHNPRKAEYQGNQNFDGLLEVLDEDGLVQVTAEIYTFDKLAGGESEFPLTYQLTLEPGRYTARYNALGKTPLEVPFEVIDRDGRLYLIAPTENIHPFTMFTEAR